MTELNIFSPEILIAGTSVIIGGIFLKLVEKLWMSKTVVDEHAVLRKELREELDAVKREIKILQDEVDTWRERYYEQVEVTNELSFEISILKTKLKIYESN
jgi:peptidoglycan hydrolase CwlO-like protein